jgi:hypothetical protein
MGGLHQRLTEIQRRSRWKTGLRVGGVALASVGALLLPRARHVIEFTKRDLSAFNAIADAGEFVGWGLACIAGGTLAVVVSFLIRGDVHD